MAVFENMLVLLVVALLLLQVSRRFTLPYPAMLALAGCAVAALPGAPLVNMDPHLALALFIAPALFDAAYDTAPRELRRNWLPLLSLVLVAVLLTTAAVAWAGVALAGLPVAAAITLGAIVAPPDAVASAAVMQRFRLPRRTVTILKGESLLNDAVALLIFGAAVSAATSKGSWLADSAPMLLLAVPGAAIGGYLMSKLYIRLAPLVAGTLSATILEFVSVFGTWILAEHLRLSPIIAVVAFGMTIARYIPSSSTPRDRVHSYSVWNASVFILNVLAFMLMGLQARVILSRMEGTELSSALSFAGIVLAIVVVVRIAWVLTYGWLLRASSRLFNHKNLDIPVPTRSVGLLVGWSGMRGLVTLATAFALPATFPGRDLIVLSAFAVVLGTLVVQGLSIKTLIKLLRIAPDNSLEREISAARTAMIDAALAELQEHTGPVADAVRKEYQFTRKLALDQVRPQNQSEHDNLRMVAIQAQRKILHALRDNESISDDAYHRIEEELDWAELSAAATDDLKMLSV